MYVPRLVQSVAGFARSVATTVRAEITAETIAPTIAFVDFTGVATMSDMRFSFL
jgi:hypothetical protein